jgi:type II secretory pathway component PulF
MRQAAIVLENTVKNKVKSLTTLMEPVLVLTMALIVGVVVVAILAPIMQLNDLAH